MPHTKIWYTLLAAAKRKAVPFSFLARKDMMKKILFFVLLTSFLFGVELHITPQKDINITSQDVDALKEYVLRTLKFHLSEKGAKRIVLDNRLLANEYLKKYKLSPFDKKYIQICVERYLADKMVQEYQKSIPIDEKVLLSYYLDHKEKYKKELKIEAVLFWFDDAKKAIDFYIQAQGKSFEGAKKLAQKLKGVMQEMGGVKPLSKFSQKVQKFIEKNPYVGYAMPPVIISPNSASVLYIKSYETEQGYKPFEDVKEQVKQEILQKAFAKMRNELLAKYKKQ